MSFWKSCNESTWPGLGIGAGIAIGVSTHQLALWMCIGIAMAFALDRAARIAATKK